MAVTPATPSRRKGSLDSIISLVDNARPSFIIAPNPSPVSGQPSPAVLSQQQILLAAHSLRLQSSSSMRAAGPPPPIPANSSLDVPPRHTASRSPSLSTRGSDRALGNDLTDEDAYEVLVELSKSDSYLRKFSDTELHELCSIFMFLRIVQGETVMKVGESASFFALLLQGSCVATVNASIGSLPLPRGSWLGEMSYFEHGVRSADVSAAEDSVLAMMTYKELNALAHSAPAMHSKLQKLLAVVSIRKLHERIDVMSAAGPPPLQRRRPSLAPAGEMFLRSPSNRDRRMAASESGAVSFSELRRSPSPTPGLPFGLNTASTTRSASLTHTRGGSVTYSADTGRSGTPVVPATPRQVSRRPSTLLQDTVPEEETLLRKRLATTLLIRDAVIWQSAGAADFNSADGTADPTPAEAVDGDAESSPSDTTNKLLQLHPSIKDLQQLTHKQKLDVRDAYHHNKPASSNKAMQPAELRDLSRDVIELVLRNYVRWLKQSKHGNKLTEAAYRAIVQVERAFLLPGKKGQTDAQAINAMSRHLTTLMTTTKAKAPSAAGRGVVPPITQELFCRSFDSAMRECMRIKTKDEGLGCSIQ